MQIEHDLMYCSDIFDQPIPYHPLNEEQIDQSLREKIQRDSLMFACEYERWNIKSDAELRYFICKKGPNWTLNQNELKKLVAHFENRFSPDDLREKAIKYGVDWVPMLK